MLCPAILPAQINSSTAQAVNSSPAVVNTTPVAVNSIPAITIAPLVCPNFMVGAGGGYSRNAKPNAAEGWIEGSFGLGGCNFSVTTVDMTSSTNTIRTGFMKLFAHSGNWWIGGRIDAGVSTVSPVIGSFAGGFVVLYDLKKVSKNLAGMFLSGEVRIIGVTSSTAAQPNQVAPGFYLGLLKSF